MSTSIATTQPIVFPSSEAAEAVEIEITGPLPTPPKESLLVLVLRGRAELNDKLRGTELPAMVAKLLGMSVAGYALHGAVVGGAAMALAKYTHSLHLPGIPALWLPIAFVLALIGALGLCLPNFYFCSQMAGLDIPLRVVAAQALRANATSAAILFGLTPFFVACALAAANGLPISADAVLWVGLVMPFAVGLFGVRAAYRGFSDIARELPAGQVRRHLMPVMMLCAGVIYTLVAPVALYRLCQAFSHLF